MVHAKTVFKIRTFFKTRIKISLADFFIVESNLFELVFSFKILNKESVWFDNSFN